MTSQRGRLVLLVLILAAGAWFRFSHLDLTRFNFDRAFPVYQAQAILRGALPWHSLNTSMGLINPAGWSYALVPLAWLPDAVTAAFVFSSTLSLLAVLLVYDLGRRIAGAPAALVVAGALAINPWAQYYGRAPWVQGPLIFGSILVAWLLWPALLGRSARPARGLALALVALGLIMQTYLVAYVLLLQVGLAAVLFRRRVVQPEGPAGPRRPAPLLAAFAVLAVLNLPFIAGAWGMRTQMLSDLQRGLTQGEPGFKTQSVEHTVRLVTGQDYELTWTAAAPDFPARRTASLAAAALLTLGLFAGAARAGLALWRRHPAEEHEFARLSVAWLAVPLLLFAYTGRPVHAFYLSSTLPASALLLGWGVAPLLTRRAGQAAVAGALAACGVVFALDVDAHYRYDDAHPVLDHIDELPWRHAAVVAQRLRTAVPEAGYVVRTPADTAWLTAITGLDVRGDNRLDDTGWWPLSDSRPSLILLQSRTPDGPAGIPAGLNDRRETLSFANGYVLLITFDAVAHHGPVSDIGWQAGGVGVQAAGNVLRVQSMWTVTLLPEERAGWYFAPFYHLVDAAGRELPFGAHGAPAEWWQNGDVYVDVVQVDLPADWPPGAYRLDYGLWDPNRNVRARFDVDGQSVDVLAVPVTLK